MFCIGNQNPWLAFCDYDDVLRIIDGKTGKILKTFPLGINAASVNEMQFLLDDEVLFIMQNYDSLRIVDTADGTDKAVVDLKGFSKHSQLTIQIDEARNNLYIGEAGGDIEGICIDLATWKIRAKVPGLVGFASASGKIIKWDDKEDNFVSYPAYTVKELVERGESLIAHEDQ